MESTWQKWNNPEKTINNYPNKNNSEAAFTSDHILFVARFRENKTLIKVKLCLKVTHGVYFAFWLSVIVITIWQFERIKQLVYLNITWKQQQNKTILENMF